MKLSWHKFILTQIVISIVSILLHSAAFATSSTEGIQVYQTNVHLSPEHKQKLAADIYRYQNADNMWDVLRHEFVLPHYEDYPQVQEQIGWFLQHQDFLLNTMTRAAPYLYFILQQTHKHHLPAEVVLLPMIESGYNPFAYSSMGASGLWQMMPGTASGFGIKQDWWYDGRRDVVASTRAALDYLTYLGSFFEGNWLLSIAAYDTGEGNILSAIKKNIRDGKDTSFWSLPLAQETRIYIPRLLALATIISNPQLYPITFPTVRNAPYLAQIDIGGQIELTNAALFAGMSLKKLKQLNPGYNRSTTAPNGPFKLVLPIENVVQFSENLAYSPDYQHINWIHYKAKSGDTFASVAKRFSITKDALHQANPSLASALKPGLHLIIPRSTPAISESILETPTAYFNTAEDSVAKPLRTEDLPKEYVSASHPKIFESLSDNGNTEFSRHPVLFSSENNSTAKNVENALEKFTGKYTLQPGDTLYMVRNNDSLPKIAKHFHTTTPTLVTVNNLTSATVRPGDKLIIPTHLSSKQSTQKYDLTPGDTIYLVRNGDDIEKIADKFHTSSAAIRLANLMTDNNLQEGDKIVIPVHV